MWYRGIRYEKAVLWADFYHEERWCIFWGHDWCEGTHVHKQVVMDRWINMMVNKEMKRGYMRCIINGWRRKSRGHAYRMFCVWIHLGMLDVTLDGCGDNGYIVVEDEVWKEKKWRSVGQQFDIWIMLLGLQLLLAMVGGQRLMKGKVDNRIFETRGQILEEELDNLYYDMKIKEVLKFN